MKNIRHRFYIAGAILFAFALGFGLPEGGGFNVIKYGNSQIINPVGGSTTPTMQWLTTGTAATYTTPAATRSIHVVMCGAGGGGGANSVNAGSAGTATLFNAIGANPGAGGGIGGSTTNAAGGSGGAGAAGLRIAGGSGQLASAFGVATPPPGPNGGGSPGFDPAGVGIAARANSCGGGAGAVQAAPGGAGEYVEFVITSPAASYLYSVGIKGAGGVPGTNAGGDGGDGLIKVSQF